MIYNRHSCIAALAAIAVTASCTRDYQALPEPNPSPENRSSETEIPVAEAVAALNRFLDSTDPVTRGGRRTIARIDRVSAADMFSAETRSEEVPDAGDLLYVVNFSGDEGYAILGADSRLDTVLIVGDKGNFDPLLLGPSQDEPIPLNPGRDSIPSPGFDPNFQIMPGLTADDLYCEEEDEYYIGAIGNVCPVDDLIVDLLVDYTMRHTIWATVQEEYEGPHGGIYNRGPLLKTNWCQEYPFNMLVPSLNLNGDPYPIGCTTTATMQILTYLKDLDLHTNFNITTSTWSDFENFTDPKTSTSTYTLRNNLAKFALCVADGIGVRYNFLFSGGTFALPAQVKSYLESLGYNINRIRGFKYKKTQLKIVESITHNIPVFISAFNKNVVKGAHAWVIDGFRIHQDSNNYFNHCNFGWSGKSNGWYYYKIFNSSDEGVTLDDPESTNTFNYTWYFRTLIISK